jgi:hypothetical protein
VRFERLGEGLAICSGEMVIVHCVDELGAEASASRSLGTAPESSAVAYGMEGTIHA